MNPGFRIGKELFELPPGTVLELEQENPFLQLGDTIQGEYSLPFPVPASDVNMRNLGYPHLLYATKNTEGIPAALTVGGKWQVSTGLIKVETGNNHLMQPQRGVINCYYLFGISDFYKLVGDKRLHQVNFGDDYTYPWRGHTYHDDGWWAHWTEVMNNGSVQNSPYAFFPMENTFDVAGDNPTKIINQVFANNNNPDLPYPVVPAYGFLGLKFYNKVKCCPYLYVKFILQRIFADVGWALETDILDDPDFNKIVVPYNNYIDWRASELSGNDVVFNLRDFVPRVKISTFLVALQNRFGWWYDPDFNKKIFRISYRKDVFSHRVKKSFDGKAGAMYSFKANAVNKVYSLTQSGASGKPALSNFNYKGVLISAFNLPEPVEATLNDYYFIQSENAYYTCQENDDNEVEWQKSYDNTIDFLPDNKTDDISTNSQVPDSKAWNLIFWGESPAGFRTMVLPVVTLDDTMGDTDTFYLCYHHGVQLSINNTGTTNLSFPFGSAGCHNLHGALLTNRALVYEYKGADDVERGIYAHNWQYFLQFMSQREEVTMDLAFTPEDLLNFRYKDTIVVRGVEFFIKNPHFKIPLQPLTTVDLIRI